MFTIHSTHDTVIWLSCVLDVCSECTAIYTDRQRFYLGLHTSFRCCTYACVLSSISRVKMYAGEWDGKIYPLIFDWGFDGEIWGLGLWSWWWRGLSLLVHPDYGVILQKDEKSRCRQNGGPLPGWLLDAQKKARMHGPCPIWSSLLGSGAQGHAKLGRIYAAMLVQKTLGKTLYVWL